MPRQRGIFLKRGTMTTDRNKGDLIETKIYVPEAEDGKGGQENLIEK